MTDYHKHTKAQLIEKLNRLQSDPDAVGVGREIKNLTHDLEVYQIELEMQNRELREKQLELEIARDKYADLYEFSPVGYLTLDNKGIIQNINLTATAMLKCDRGQVLEKPFTVFLSNGKSRDFFHALRVVMTDGEKQNLELLLRSKDQSTIFVRLKMVPPLAGKQEVRAVLIDISEQKTAEDNVREHREALLHADRLSLLGELSSGIAHEVSQPIAAIAVYAAMLSDLTQQSDRLDESELVEIAKQVSAQSERAGLVLDRVRSFARREEPCQSQQLILDVINEATGFMEPLLKQNDVSVTVRKKGSIQKVTIDRVQIIQVLANLLHNAIEAMKDTPSHDREIIIEVKMPNKNYVELAIKDKGTGIPHDERDQVFMPFYTTRAKGLGLGLSLSHSIIQSHGGRMWTEPNQQQGTVFRFTLPVAHNKKK